MRVVTGNALPLRNRSMNDWPMKFFSFVAFCAQPGPFRFQGKPMFRASLGFMAGIARSLFYRRMYNRLFRKSFMTARSCASCAVVSFLRLTRNG